MRTRCCILLSSIIPAMLSAQGWEPMADLPVDLTFPVVVELNGNIHVMGGGGPTGASNVHMRYTPATNAWDYRANVPYLAQQPCGAVVDGKIHYCAGGFPNTGTPLNDHYVYDPVADSWTQAADLPFPTAINEAASINGLFYVLTGQPNKQLCQSYDPATDSWTSHASLPDLNFWYGAVLAMGNTIYRFGGGGYIAPVNLAHVYDVGNDSWTTLPTVPEASHAIAGANVGDSLICLSGGYFNPNEYDDVWLYHPLSQLYQVLEPLPVGRSYHAMVSAGNCVYVIGGSNQFDPDMGVSMIRNCSIGVVGLDEGRESAWRPYLAAITPSLAQVQLAQGGGSDDQVELMDAQGKVILRRSFASGSVTLRGEDLGPGVYHIVITVDGKRYVERWANGR